MFDIICFWMATKLPSWGLGSVIQDYGSADPGIRKKYFRILSTVEKHKCLSAAQLSLSVLSWLSPLAHEEALERLSPSNSLSKFGSGSPPSSGDSLWRCERPWNYHFSIPETQNFMNLWPNNSWKILFEFFSSVKQISSFVKVCIFYKQLSHDSFVKM